MRKLAAAMALICLLMLPGLAFAQLTSEGSGLDATAGAAYGATALNNENSNVGLFIGKYIIQPVIGLTGLMFLILTVYAGIMWMTSGGDSKRVDKAKTILVTAVTGAVIIAAAYVIVNTVIGALSGSSVNDIQFQDVSSDVVLNPI